jgi:hypothetical protein
LSFLLIPLASLFGFAGESEYRRLAKRCSHSVRQQGVEPLNARGNGVHELQMERGRSARFISSRGEEVAVARPAQRQENAQP